LRCWTNNGWLPSRARRAHERMCFHP
jgi:hypothetical protein